VPVPRSTLAADVVGAERAATLGVTEVVGLRVATRALWFAEGRDPGPGRPGRPGPPQHVGGLAFTWADDGWGDGGRWPLDRPEDVRRLRRGPDGRCEVPGRRVGDLTVAACGAPDRLDGSRRGDWRVREAARARRAAEGLGPPREVACGRRAGEGTNHYGVGLCSRHGGLRFRGRTGGAWLVGHAFARELDCTPWEGLLRAVRIAAGRVEYCQAVLGAAAHDRELEGRVTRSEDGLMTDPDTGDPLGVGQFRDRSWWVTQSELWTDRLARYSKLAVDAGVAERLVAQVELDAQRIGRVLNASLGALAGLPEEVQLEARAAMRRELLLIEAEDRGELVAVGSAGGGRVIDGELGDAGRDAG